jgi:hypothetical protein
VDDPPLCHAAGEVHEKLRSVAFVDLNVVVGVRESVVKGLVK